MTFCLKLCSGSMKAPCYTERIGGVGASGRRCITDSRAQTDIFLTNFGRTELIIGASRAKRCEEVDFEVRFSLEAPKPSQKCEKRFPRPKNLADKKMLSSRFFGLGNRFAPFWTNFGGSTEKRTSTANSSQFFALDAPIMSSVRPKIVKNMSVCVRCLRCVDADHPRT